MDHFCDSLDSLAAGIDDRLYDWWSHSYPLGRRHHRDACPGHSGKKACIANYAATRKGKLFTY